jgi:hypothetical protein
MPWWLPALVPVAVGLSVGAYGAGLGRTWRAVLSLDPFATVPVAGLLIVAIGGGLGIVLGLALTVTRRGLAGPTAYAFGVGLTCGVMIGFVTGPG